MQPMKPMQAIKQYFDGVTLDELKALTKDERLELATLAAAELGVDLET